MQTKVIEQVVTRTYTVVYRYRLPVEGGEPYSNPNEVWKEIPGSDGNYLASNLGRFLTVKRKAGRRNLEERLLRTFIDAQGYISVGHSKKGLTKRVHRLLMMTFVGPPPEGYVVNHLDGNRTNNDLSNLEYCTPRENVLHGIRRRQAERHPT